MNFMKILDNFNFEWILFLVLFTSLIGLYFYPKELNVKLYKIIFVLIFLDVIFIGLSLVPPDSFDLYRYYAELRYYSIVDFPTAMKLIFERPNFVWYIFLMIISIFENVKLIFLSDLFSFAIYIFVLFKCLDLKKINYKQANLSVCVFLSIISFLHTLSGLRNLLAVSFSCLSFVYFNKERKVLAIIFSIIALLIHPMTVIFVMILLLSELLIKFKKERLVYLLLVVKPFLHIMLFIISKIPVSIFKLYSTKMSLELSGKYATDYRVFVLEIIQILVLTLFVYFVKKRVKDYDKKDYKMINFIYCLLIFVLGSIGMINIFIRTRFILAFVLPYLFHIKNKYIKDDKLSKFNLENILMIISVLINLYYIYYMLCNGVFV